MDRRSHTPKGQLSRARILRAAEPLLAARGFHGTSMRDVADAAGVPLASVVYHFARKEKLYAAVLGDIADELLSAIGEPGDLAAAARALVRWSVRHPGRVRLLTRELLDNPARVSRARSLPLAPVLTTLAEAVGRAGHPYPEIAVMHVFGAVSYVVAAHPTVRRIVGPDRDRELVEKYEDEAVAFACRTFQKEQADASRSSDRARPEGPRAPRGEDDGRGSGGRDARRPRVRRSEADRA
jgi:AcrR family transcriptional regulator